MKKPTTRPRDLKQLSTDTLSSIVGGDNPGMGPYDPPPPPPTGSCWIKSGGVYIPNSITGDDCPLVWA